MATDPLVSRTELVTLLAAFPPPTLLDVRRVEAFERDPHVIPGALRCAPEDVASRAASLDPWRPVVVYCVRGHEVGCDAARELRARGLDAKALGGGLEAWVAAGGATVPWRIPTRWVTRERPKIDRIACPWLVRRFVDPSAEFFYVPAADVRSFAAAQHATPYDVAGVEYTHEGDRCSFDTFMRLHRLDDPALVRLAAIVRGADTGHASLAPQVEGLLAVSQGLSRAFADDHAMLRWGMLMYDALYAWCRGAPVTAAGKPVAMPA